MTPTPEEVAGRLEEMVGDSFTTMVNPLTAGGVLVRQAAALIRSLDADRRSQAERIEKLEGALRAVSTELWWCAIQLGCSWKDAEWRERSSVGRAYEAALAALERS